MRRFFLWFLLLVSAGGFILLHTDYSNYAFRFYAYLTRDRTGENSKTVARTEEQWLAGQICRQIGEIVFFAKNGPNTNARDLRAECELREPRSFEVVVEWPALRVTKSISLKDQLWDENNYKPIVEALLSASDLHMPPASDQQDSELLEQTASGDMAVLIRAAKQVSESLTRSPLDAALHEKAAFIIACFALHEAAGIFSDVRPALNQITAHLAIAQQLEHKQSDCGRIAKIISLSLAGREAEAVASLSTLPPSLNSWITTLQIRTTGNWRALADPEHGTRLQQFEYFRALRERGLCPKSRKFLAKLRGARDPDWIRIAMEDNLSVDEGHAFAGPSLYSEFQSAVDDYQSFFGGTLSRQEFVDVVNRTDSACLNKAPAGTLQLDVLSWGTLAAFHQRHLCHSLVRTEYFLQCSWGVREEAKKFRENAQQFLARMTMFPLARQFFTVDDSEKKRATEQALKVTRDHPELVTATAWSGLGPNVGEHGERGLPHEALAWFAQFPVPGTSYDFAARYKHFRAGRDAVTLEQLVHLAPFNHYIIAAKLEGLHQTGQQIDVAYAPLKEFDVRAMWQIAEAHKDQPDTYGKMLEPLCELHPDYFLILGQYYVDKQMPAEAAVAYQKAFELAEDRVYMANSSRWIVDYYFDHGRVDDALKIATDAADVYSHAGLCTMAHLMERMKRYSEAERYYEKVHKRYDDQAVLDTFYLRNRDNAPEYARRSDQLKAAAFPRGMENAHLHDFNGPPSDGVSIATSNNLVRGAHLKEGDVIVAINNVRVHSEKQYILVRDMDPDPNMILVVWNGAQYSERKVNVPNRRFYCKLADFKGR